MFRVRFAGKLGFLLVMSFVLTWGLRSAGAVTGRDNDELIPLIDMGSNSYYGFAGGLYPDGGNQTPAQHAAVGAARGQAVQPLNVNGNPDPAGKIIFLSVGISNAGREFCAAFYQTDCIPFSFVNYGLADPEVNHTSLVWVNGARSGQSAEKWDHPSEYNYEFIANNLAAIGLSPNQVQVIWLKVMNGDTNPTLPDPNADAFILLARLGNILRTLKIKYPNLQQVFVSSRSYGGFVENVDRREPIPYETGFAFKWLIEAQIEQMANNTIDPITGDLNYNTVAPWVDWSAYLWASTTPRSDGLFWERADFGPDGSHVSDQGRVKVSNLMMAYFKYSPFTQPWFVAGGSLATPTATLAPTVTNTPPPAGTLTPTPTPSPVITNTPTNTASPAGTVRPTRTPAGTLTPPPPTPTGNAATPTPRPTRQP